MNLRTRLKDMGGSALIAFMMSFSLTCILLGSAVSDYSRPAAALCCGAVVLVCALSALNRLTAVIAAACGVAGCAALALLRVNPFESLARAGAAVASLIESGHADLRPELLTLMIFLAVLFGVAAMLMVRLSGGVYPAVLLFVFVLLGSWFLTQKIPHWPLIPGLIALAVLYARAFRESGSVLRALPAALIAALLAVMLTPSAPVTWQPLQDAADKVREMFNDYFMFNDPRIVYSVAADGYQPQVDQLGGPATPRREDVMRVKTDTSLLLRGSVSRTYTGGNWVDEAVNSRYLFLDPTRLNRRSAAFDTDMVNRLGQNARRVQAEITFLSEGTSTLFVPHRLTELSARVDMPVYYNETGEVFITRGVQPGDSYAIEAWNLDGDWTSLASAIEAAADALDGDWNAVCAEYLNLPGSIEADLYWLVMDLTQDIESPVRKALALRDHLTGGDFAYDLNGRYPEAGRDFVSWFVLEEKKGYCTYFASAMAVMARLAGIPARYAEGYRVMSDGSGEALVTGEDAHAWAELYFNGIGWIAFDATPGRDGQNGGEPDSGSQDGDQSPTPTPAPSATPEPTQNSGDPDGSGQQSTPEPTEEPTSAPDSQAEATPQPDDGEPSADDQPDEPDEKKDRRPPTWLFWLLALLLLALAACLLLRRRFVRTGPKYLADHEADGRVKLMIWYRAILGLLARFGLMPEGGESPEAFAARAVQGEGMPVELADLAREIARSQYAGLEPDSRTLRQGEIIYGALLRRMSRRQRLAWHADRMVHGIGDYGQIP